MIALDEVATDSDVQPWRTIFDVEDMPHILPSFGPEHVLTMQCWCHPVLDADYVEPAISHNVAQ